jgi:RimJ/RimL family protein N-acetyltransferase
VDATLDGVRVRYLEDRDLDVMIEMWTDADVATFHGDYGPRDPDAIRTWLGHCHEHNATPDGGRNCAIVDAATDETVGWIGFGGSDSRPGDIDVGYAVVPRHRGRGVASTALRIVVDHCFVVLGVASVYGECRKDNIASAKVLTRAGLHPVDSPDATQQGFIVER